MANSNVTSALTVHQIPSYVLSLDENKHKNFEKKFHHGKGGISNIKPILFTAVNGEKKGNEMKGKQNKISTAAQRDIEVRTGRGSHSSFSGWGSVGCYLSHVELWKIAKQSKHGIIIFEDDAMINGNLPSVKSKNQPMKKFEDEVNRALEDFQKQNGHLLYLTIKPSQSKKDIEGVTSISRVTGRTYGTWAYYISPEGASILLNKAFPLEEQVDSFIGSVTSLGSPENVNKTQSQPFNVYMTKKKFFIHSPTSKKSSTQTKKLMRNELMGAAENGVSSQIGLVLSFYIMSVMFFFRLTYSSNMVDAKTMKELQIYVVALTIFVAFYMVRIFLKAESLKGTKKKLNWV